MAEIVKRLNVVKVRDVPFDEISYHFISRPENAEELWEAHLRGKNVGLTGDRMFYPHIGRFGYETNRQINGWQFWVCDICAEIED